MNQIKMNRENRINGLILILFFLGFTAVLFFAPHTVDDNYYDYLNLTRFTDILKFSAGYGNGRVLGNMLGVYLCKSRTAAAVVRSGTLTLLLYFFPKLFDNKVKSSALLCTALMIIGLGSKMFGQTYSWISCFANYLPPVLAVILCLYIIKESRTVKKPAWMSFVPVIVLGYTGQLYTENSALNNCMLAFFLLVTAFFIKKENWKLPLAFFLSTGLGGATMLALRLFCTDERGLYKDFDYKIETRSLAGFVFSNFNRLSWWTSQFFVLLIILLAEVLIIIKYSDPDKPVLKKLKLPVSVCFILNTAVSLLNYIVNNKYVRGVHFITTVCFFICLLLLTYYLGKEKRMKYLSILIFLYISAAYPLLLNPIAVRMYFYTYMVFISIVLLLLPELTGRLSEKALKNSSRAAGAVLCAACAAIFVIQVGIYRTNIKVNDFIAQQVSSGQSEAYLCKVTRTEYFHHSYSDVRLGRTYYRNEPFDVEFINVSTDEWEKIYEEWNGENSAR